MNEVILINTDDIRDFLYSYKLDDLDYLSVLLDLLDISDSRKDNVVFIAIAADEIIVSAGLFSIGERQILAVRYTVLYIYGYSFFDYNQIYVVPSFKEKFIGLLKDYSILNIIDLVLLENIKGLSFDNKYIIQKNTIQVFDPALTSKKFAYIFGKKSLKRHNNIVERNYGYKIEHLKGSLISNKNYQDLINFHKERWSFDNIQSAFNDEKRIEFYKNLKERALMTIITLDNEVFAMHFGILHNKRLIWHTPVLNIKFLNLSPIEVLLFETSQFCSTNNIKFLDFGLGNEKYKYRFSNSEEFIYDYVISIHLKIKIIIFLAKYLKGISTYLNVIPRLKEIYSFLNRINIVTNRINIYKMPKDSLRVVELVKDVKFTVINTYNDFVSFLRMYNLPVKRFQFTRFKEGDSYYCIHNDTTVFCDGWSRNKSIFISEINKDLIIDNGCILYDFNTALEFRREGYYKYLLKNIIAVIDSELYIYSLKGNIPSNRAIQSVGFHLTKHNFSK